MAANQDVLVALPVERWDGPFAPELRERALDALERGRVLYCPRLAFLPTEAEQSLLSPTLSDGKAKNISFDPATGRCQGTSGSGGERQRLVAMMDRFARQATQLLVGLMPGYAAGIERARTSFRPVEIAGRHYSPLKDDKLLHIDAFPSRPTRGRRILRVFSNISPTGQARLWQVGEPFEDFARRFAPRLRYPVTGEAWLLKTLGITKGRRSLYDHFMLGLHDNGKRDRHYQGTAPHADITFQPGVTWLCYTDQVLHAAHAGQYALEQTFHVDVEVMGYPERSPLRVLERLMGRPLL